MKLILIAAVIVVLGAAVYVVIRNRLVPRNGSSGQTPSGSAPSRDIAKLVEPLNKPAILIKTTDEVSTSYFGGIPPNHHGFAWPERNGRPLGFLACIDLAQIGNSMDWLPQAGLLLFFYDMKEQPWGFDPKDRDAWAVVHVLNSSVVEGYAPEPARLKDEWKIKQSWIHFETASIPPSWEEDVLRKFDLSDEEADALDELRLSLYAGSPHHQIGGYPDPIQNPSMNMDCQLASHGLYCGNSTGYNDSQAEQLKPGASQWQLLLQMDSDDTLDVMWGDVGMIYFWVKVDDARRGDFSNVWLILQCH